MKKYIIYAALALLIGCATFKSTASKFLASTAQTVDATMQGWALLVVSGQTTPEQEANVKGIYQQYQRSMLIASNAWEVTIATGDKTGWIVASNTVYQQKLGLLTSTQTSQMKGKQ